MAILAHIRQDMVDTGDMWQKIGKHAIWGHIMTISGVYMVRNLQFWVIFDWFWWLLSPFWSVFCLQNSSKWSQINVISLKWKLVLFLNNIHQKYVQNVSIKLQVTVFEFFLSNFAPFLIHFLHLEHLKTISDQCNWSQMKAF